MLFSKSNPPSPMHTRWRQSFRLKVVPLKDIEHGEKGVTARGCTTSNNLTAVIVPDEGLTDEGAVVTHVGEGEDAAGGLDFSDDTLCDLALRRLRVKLDSIVLFLD